VGDGIPIIISTTQTQLTCPVSWLKYSTVKATTGDAPWLELALHANLVVVSVTSITSGRDGGPGNADGSGVRWKMTRGLDDASTTR